MDKLRTFLSLNINNSLKEIISGIQSEIKKLLLNYDIKWEAANKFHLTIRFLGNIEPKDIDFLIKEFNDVSFVFEKIKFTTGSIDFFPDKKKPNVIFLGLKEDGNNSEILTGKIDKIISKLGIVPDKKFVPHFTLGRFRRENRNGVTDKIFPEPEHLEFEFDRFYLMKSIIDSHGAKHFVIKDFLFQKI